MTTKPCDFFGGADPAKNYFRKNLLINGNCQINQRGSIHGVVASNYDHPVDGWYVQFATGFSFQIGNYEGNYTGMYNSSSQPLTATNDYYIPCQQKIENLDVKHLSVGGPVTLSFNARSSAIGEHCVTIQVYDSARVARSILKTFNVTQANEWEYHSVTVDIPENYIDGAPELNGSHMGIRLYIGAVSGSAFQGSADTWVESTTLFCTSNTVRWGSVLDAGTVYRFSAKELQLEVGSTATDFEYRSYGEDLALCQRYCWQGYAVNNGQGRLYNTLNGTSLCGPIIPFPVTMRDLPTMTIITEPTYENCSHGFIGGSAVSTTGAIHRLTKDGTTGVFSASFGLYRADAEL